MLAECTSITGREISPPGVIGQATAQCESIWETAHETRGDQDRFDAEGSKTAPNAR